MIGGGTTAVTVYPAGPTLTDMTLFLLVSQQRKHKFCSNPLHVHLHNILALSKRDSHLINQATYVMNKFLHSWHFHPLYLKIDVLNTQLYLWHSTSGLTKPTYIYIQSTSVINNTAVETSHMALTLFFDINDAVSFSNWLHHKIKFKKLSRSIKCSLYKSGHLIS